MPIDLHRRPLGNLRLSVTDRCNLRCAYCMPEESYRWLPKASLLSFEEISELVDRFTALGVDRVRITGGEPLLRRDLDRLVRQLADKAAVRDLALTTNGVLLAEQARGLRAAGLQRMTVSLDTLRADRFSRLTRRTGLSKVLEGLEEAAQVGFDALKIDTVVMRGENDDEMLDLLELARRLGAELRFIEYMDVGGATRWTPERVLSRATMLERLEASLGAIEVLPGRATAPAERFRLADGTIFGIIASTTEPFCVRCDRSRLTADGHWYRCLYAVDGEDLASLLRAGASPGEIEARIAGLWSRRDDRGAEARLEAEARGALVTTEALARDPHLEMHTRGG